jgi:hypothetical protein
LLYAASHGYAQHADNYDRLVDELLHRRPIFVSFNHQPAAMEPADSVMADLTRGELNAVHAPK